MSTKDKITFRFEGEFPIGHPYMLGNDLAYMQDRIRVHRATNPGSIDTESSRYYEAGIALLDLVDYIMQSRLNYSPKSCKINIDPGIITTVELDGEVVPLSLSGNIPTQIGLKFRLVFTDYKTDFHPAGFFKVDMYANETLKMTVGDTPLKDVAPVGPGFHPECSDDMCFKANPNGAMRYCENFPMPSNFVNMICDTWCDIITKLTD